jgi:hypothetical protein
LPHDCTERLVTSAQAAPRASVFREPWVPAFTGMTKIYCPCPPESPSACGCDRAGLCCGCGCGCCCCCCCMLPPRDSVLRKPILLSSRSNNSLRTDIGSDSAAHVGPSSSGSLLPDLVLMARFLIGGRPLAVRCILGLLYEGTDAAVRQGPEFSCFLSSSKKPMKAAVSPLSNTASAPSSKQCLRTPGVA